MAHEYVPELPLRCMLLMGKHCGSSQAYYLRDQDHWTKIDYSAKATTWMKPLTRGNETGLVEIPANWYVLS